VANLILKLRDMAKNNKINFLNYIGKAMSRESIAIVYGSNNIRYEKCELYSDFVQSLLIIIFDTYLGDDVMNPEAQIKHFKWCWDKNIQNFKDEGIEFKNDKIYIYFFEFMLDSFYFKTDKEKFNFTDTGLLNIWSDLFNYNKLKTRNELDAFIEIYTLMDFSLTK
jgi:hypothetical protein